MFQDFTDSSDANASAARTISLREHLKAYALDGFIVPHADEYQNEYLPPHAERLAWLTGFTGSAGSGVLLRSKAAVFVDGRYVLQAGIQVDKTLYEICLTAKTSLISWLAQNLEENITLGYDPWLHTVNEAHHIREVCTRVGATLVAIEDNPIDALWHDRPALPCTPAVAHPLALAGRDSLSKRESIAATLIKDNIQAALLTQPDSIAWLLNVRGLDVPHTPLVLSFALLYSDSSIDWFVNPDKTGNELLANLDKGIRPCPPADLFPALESIGAKGGRVHLDPTSTADLLAQRLKDAGADSIHGLDPCLLPKACKNPTEISGARAAHKRDGVALAVFLCWLEEQAPQGGVDEISAAHFLEEARAKSGALKDLSFDTISGAGSHGAIVHYQVTEKTNRPIESDMLYLVDSGAQYADGTTDVTRTVAIGTPTDEQKDRFTRILKGHIALARARFPDKTTGAQLDALARLPLWQAGLDFGHGTGHGVGSYLSVHEGPQRISSNMDSVALQSGMILSNEPGYYKAGDYGIRIENLLVVQAPQKLDGGEQLMLGFEILTLAPIDLSLVVKTQLLSDELAWLNTYHARVRDEISPLVDDKTRLWLEHATRAL
ncbi:MAG: aminopeptidase P family protein [Parvularculales bacterium]